MIPILRKKQDTDGDGIPNYLDDDDDGDGMTSLFKTYISSLNSVCRNTR